MSVIRIAGRPILPPLITAERRAEILKDKQLAVAREALRKKKQCPPKTLAATPTGGENVRSARTEISSSAPASSSFVATESTELGKYVNTCGDFSPGSAGSTTVADECTETADLASMTPRLMKAQNGCEREGLQEQQPVSLRVRSNSFTLDGPSPALVNHYKSLASVQPNLPRTPPSAGRQKPHDQSCSDVSPILSEKFVRLMVSDNRSESTPVALMEKLRQIEEMQEMLEQYHRLQLDELQRKQMEEMEKILEKKRQLESLQSTASSFTPETELSMQNESCARDVQPVVWNSDVSLVQFDFTRPSSSSGNTQSRNTAMETFPDKGRQPLAALIKRHLVRRLMQTDKIRKARMTVKELRVQIEAMEKEGTNDDQNENYNFKDMLEFHLKQALKIVHDTFFTISVVERMNLIARKRAFETAARFKEQTAKTGAALPQKNPKRLSLATQKSLARKATVPIEAQSASTTNRKRTAETPKPFLSHQQQTPRRPQKLSTATQKALIRKGLIPVSDNKAGAVVHEGRRRSATPGKAKLSLSIARQKRRSNFHPGKSPRISRPVLFPRSSAPIASNTQPNSSMSAYKPKRTMASQKSKPLHSKPWR